MAVLYKRIQLKDFNPQRLMGELPSPPIQSVGWAGFEQITSRLYRPFVEASRVVGHSSATGDDVAERGELRFFTDPALTIPQEAQLDAALLAHDATVLTPEQIRQDRDSVDVTDLRALYDARDSLTAEQQRQMRNLIMRMVIRRFGEGHAI